MELQLPADVRLPIQTIRDANLTWVRTEAGSQRGGDELLRSLQEQRMQLPILLTEEFVVVDGARRLLRAEQLGWQTVPVLVTSDWDLVQRYFQTARKLEAAGLPHEPMTWAEITDLVAGPLSQLYHGRRVERHRIAKAANAARRAAGLAPFPRAKHGYTKDAAEVLGWREADLKGVRELYWALASLQAQEDAARKAAHRKGGAEAQAAVPRYAQALRAEALRLESHGKAEGGGGLYSLLRKLRWTATGNNPADFKAGAARRKVGEPTTTQRRARAAVDTSAVGRELDATTLARLTQVLTDLGIEASAYTHLRPSVRTEDARSAAADIKAAVNRINALARVIKRFAFDLEEHKS